MRVLIAISLAAALGGCATVVRGTTESVAIATDPPGAEARTSNGFGCSETPCEIIVPRKDPFVLSLAKPGYQPVDMAIETTVKGGGTAGMVGNVVSGGLIGVAVDASNGSTLDHTPNPVFVRLKPEETVPPVVQQRRRRGAPVS